MINLSMSLKKLTPHKARYTCDEGGGETGIFGDLYIRRDAFPGPAPKCINIVLRVIVD